MHWAKWWTALFVAALLSLTVVMARAEAQEPYTGVPSNHHATWQHRLATDLQLVYGLIHVLATNPELSHDTTLQADVGFR